MTADRDAASDRLLLVDDEAIIVATIAEGLRRAGFDVTTATSSANAIEIARDARFALAILDYAMPGENGLTVAETLARLGQPFMFLSAYSDESLVAAVVSVGALAFAVKPIDPIQLIPTVRAATQRAREMFALVQRNEQLTRAIDSNRDVSVAVGLLMAQRGLPRQAAYETLRQHARRTRRKLADVALEVTAGVEALLNIPAAENLGGVGAKSSGETDESSR